VPSKPIETFIPESQRSDDVLKKADEAIMKSRKSYLQLEKGGQTNIPLKPTFVSSQTFDTNVQFQPTGKIEKKYEYISSEPFKPTITNVEAPSYPPSYTYDYQVSNIVKQNAPKNPILEKPLEAKSYEFKTSDYPIQK